MSTERTIVRGFYNRNEEPPEPIKEDRRDISNEEDGSESMNITWVIWAFGIALALLIMVSTTSLIMNIQTRNKVNKIEQCYDQRFTGRTQKSL